jgi:hypothetical protein
MHGDMQAGFVEKHQTVTRNPADDPQERLTSRLDVGAIHFLWPAAFF